MLRHFAVVAGVICTALLLAVVFWFVNFVVAPHVFFFVAQLFGVPGGSPALFLLALTGPTLVAIPFGYGFGLLPWRRPILTGLFVIVLAAALNIADYVRVGINLVDSVAWVNFLEAALLIVLFVIAAAFGARSATHWAPRNRLIAGGSALACVCAATVVATYLAYRYVMAFARAA